MSDSRRDFLLRFAVTALAATGAGCEAPAEEPKAAGKTAMESPQPHVVYGPPPIRPDQRPDYFYTQVGNRVFFGNGRLDLDPDARAALDRQIEWLVRHPSWGILLEGHSDSHGTREFAIGIGQRRAELVKTYMVSKGLAPDRINVISFGKERPADPADTAAARALNRRVETRLVDR